MFDDVVVYVTPATKDVLGTSNLVAHGRGCAHGCGKFLPTSGEGYLRNKISGAK
jgi:hypothetical protein